MQIILFSSETLTFGSYSQIYEIELHRKQLPFWISFRAHLSYRVSNLDLFMKKPSVENVRTFKSNLLSFSKKKTINKKMLHKLAHHYPHLSHSMKFQTAYTTNGKIWLDSRKLRPQFEKVSVRRALIQSLYFWFIEVSCCFLLGFFFM